MSASATFAEWTAACIASGHGGDNILRVGRERYVIGEPRAQVNGALVGRVHMFTQKGLSEIGGYKIRADGHVVELPDPLIGHLSLTWQGAANPVPEDVQ